MEKNNEKISVLDNNKNKEYYVVRNKYLAESMAFLGYTYKNLALDKKHNIVSEIPKFTKALTRLMELRKEVGQYREIK